MCNRKTVELDELLGAMDPTAANLAKLDAVWQRAQPFIPTAPSLGSYPEYDDLRRTWHDLLPGLPEIDGWTVREELPDINELGIAYLEYHEINQPVNELLEAGAAPGRALDEYRFRLNRARRRAARSRLEQLIQVVEMHLPRIVAGVPLESTAPLTGLGVDAVSQAVAEMERLIGDTAERRGRWGDLHRHLWFGQGHDWHDIVEFDWPSVRGDVEAAMFTDANPLPVPEIDLGAAARGHITGSATVALPWANLSDDAFERLLYDLLRDIPEHENVQWLMQTRAPDRGRDLSLDRVLRDGTGGVRTERVMVQAKHWLRRSVSVADLAATVAQVKAWEPPVVRVLITATTGRFTADAVAYAEQHNHSGGVPYIELWPESRLETLLSQRSHLAAAHGLR